MNIGVVIVTYNRIDKLKETLKQFSLQTRKQSYIFIAFYTILKKELEKTKYLKDGFLDAINQKFGLHPVYRPGLKKITKESIWK